MPKRIDKINDFIRDQISLIINKNISLKQGVFVSVTKVDTSKDLRYTKVFISIFPETEINYAMKTLKKEIFHIQKRFNQKFTSKNFPKIHFEIDTTGNKITKLDKIFDQIANEQK